MSLAALFMFTMVCKVSPLSLCDKSDRGRPQCTGVWLLGQNEEYFVESWEKEGLIIFSVKYDNISLPLESRLSDITVGQLALSPACISSYRSVLRPLRI